MRPGHRVRVVYTETAHVVDCFAYWGASQQFPISARESVEGPTTRAAEVLPSLDKKLKH